MQSSSVAGKAMSHRSTKPILLVERTRCEATASCREGDENRARRLSTSEITAAILRLVPVNPSWAGHPAVILGDLRPVGGAAIARVYVGPIQLLLVELELAGARGLAFADRLRALRPEPRVAFMSADARKELIHRGQLARGLAFTRKPFEGDELALTLDAALAAQR